MLIKRFGIYLMVLLYSFILIPFDNEQTPLLTEPYFATEISEGSSSDLSTIQIYFSEFDSQVKIFSENEESNKLKKNQEKQFHSHSGNSNFPNNKFPSKGVIRKLKICNSETGFNYVAHSYW